MHVTKDKNQRKRTLTFRINRVSCEIFQFPSLAKTRYEVLRNTVFLNGGKKKKQKQNHPKTLKVDLHDNATTWNKII